MPDRFVESHICKLPLFAQLPPQQLEWISDAFKVMRVEPGELIFQQGQPARGLYMLASGRAQLVQSTGQGPVQIVGEVRANQYVNESALFQEHKETASLRAVETCTVLFLSRQSLMDVVSLHPEIKQNLPIPLPAIEKQARERVFRGQRENETILLDTRRHWWALVYRGWLPMLVFGVVLILSGFIPTPGVAFGVIAFAMLIVGLILIYFYLEWRNDHMIITDQRVIRIEHTIHNFKTSISEIPLTSIIEVNADLITADPFSRLFDYGTVDIKTAGTAGNLHLTAMPHPDAIQDLIFEYRSQVKQRQEQEYRSTIRAEVDKVLGKNSTFQGSQSLSTTPSTRQQSWSPWQVKYENDRGEMVYRKYLTVYARSIFFPALVVLFCIALLLLSFALPVLRDLGVIVPVFAFFLFLISVIWLYWVDWDWRNDLYIVGDSTIQLIHRRPLWLQNETDQILLSSVDNVVSEKGGFFQSLLDYGDVKISLLGGDKKDAKVFRAVKSPQEVQSEITRRQARLKRKAQEDDERRRRDEIAQYLAVYHETLNPNAQSPAMPQYANPPAPADVEPPPRPVFDRMRPPKVPRMRLP